VLEFERDVLSGAGAEVVTCMDGEEMKSLLRKRAFDALIIDGRMPKQGSLPDVYAWIAKHSEGLEKHLLVTFSSAAEPEIRDFMQANNIPYLSKPFEVADLISQARRLLEKVQAAGAS